MTTIENSAEPTTTTNNNPPPEGRTLLRLSDEKPPSFLIPRVHLKFQILQDSVEVWSRLEIRRQNPQERDLFLDGEDLLLQELYLDQRKLGVEEFRLFPNGLMIENVPDSFVLEVKVKLFPEQNKTLSGLYRTGASLLTQCEAQGFRRITYFLDRPDVLSTYTVSIEASRKDFPVLLANGQIDHTAQEIAPLPEHRHRIHWQDPFPKPCYLFALVAGDFACLTDSFTTCSGKSVTLELYAPHGRIPECHHAMESLKKAMLWDEQRFGREYDLDRYMIVATDDFNGGAMENKGLNIFNSRLVYFDPQTATDRDAFNIESVIAHEYFHNWTGNRVTLRSWFHLSLKEGLTVFRDQEFSRDLHDPDLTRIETVASLREGQFIEDAGPNRHPVLPKEGYAVDNFFTGTIYEKGAEIIRMILQMSGREAFRRGMDLFFERHDGCAVGILDFVQAMQDGTGLDLRQFQQWYHQSGTPLVKMTEHWHTESKTLNITMTQDQNPPLHIPLETCFLGVGSFTPPELKALHHNSDQKAFLELRQPSQTWSFTGFPERPLVSINRQFSAPIRLVTERTRQDLMRVIRLETDGFNRWDALQELMLIDWHEPQPDLFEVLQSLMLDNTLSEQFRALLLERPSENQIWQRAEVFDPFLVRAQSKAWQGAFAQHSKENLWQLWQELSAKPEIVDLTAAGVGLRALRNKVLAYLAHLPEFETLAWEQLQSARLMTDAQAALRSCLHGKHREQADAFFLTKWEHDGVTLNKWFSALASSSHEQTTQRVMQLWEHKHFDSKNPNRIYSTLLPYLQNYSALMGEQGRGYQWVAEKVAELDDFNPQVAARVAGDLDSVVKMPRELRVLAHKTLSELLKRKLSPNTFEPIEKIVQELSVGLQGNNT